MVALGNKDRINAAVLSSKRWLETNVPNIKKYLLEASVLTMEKNGFIYVSIAYNSLLGFQYFLFETDPETKNVTLIREHKNI